MEEVFRMTDGHRKHLGLFKLVYFLVNVFECLIVGGAEVLSVGDFGDFLEGCLVDVNFHLFIYFASPNVGGRVGGVPLSAYANGINADAIRRRNLRRAHRLYLAAIVHTVGEEDYNLALGVAVLDTCNCVGKSHADSRTVVDDAVFDLRHKVDEGAAVSGEGALRETFARKEDNADAVVFTRLNELAGNVFGGFEAVGLEVASLHRTRNIHRYDDVDAFFFYCFVLGCALWTSNCNYYQCNNKEIQHRRQPRQNLAQSELIGSKIVQHAEFHRRIEVPQLEVIPNCERYEYRRNQPKSSGVCKMYIVEHFSWF